MDNDRSSIWIDREKFVAEHIDASDYEQNQKQYDALIPHHDKSALLVVGNGAEVIESMMNPSNVGSAKANREYNDVIVHQEQTRRAHFRDLPTTWKKVTTCQHISHQDYVLQVLQFRDEIRRVLTVVAGENLNKGSVGRIMSGCGASFIPRSGVPPPLANVHRALENILVFIEGTRARGWKNN